MINIKQALLLKLFKQYQILGFELTKFEAEKLAYFLQRFGEPLNINFSKSPYGPFAKDFQKLLNSLEKDNLIIWESNNSYLPEIILKAEKFSEINDFINRNCSSEQKKRLETVSKFIESFEFPLGMEILSTVDFIITKNPEIYNNLDKIVELVQSWSKRKKELMKPKYISIAYNRLKEYKDYLYSETLVSQ